ncbi:two-component regulator propeller domain-containing protein [Bacteroidota bacterium]
MNKIIYFFLCIHFSVYTQINDFKLNNLSTINGLSQSSVIAIHQDNLGQIWLGTRDGLNKYDGSNFTVYRNNPIDSLSISNNDVLSIEIDSEENIWVGTYNGLNCYNPKNNSFKRFFHSKSEMSLSNNTIWCIKEIGNEVWIGTAKGLSIYNKKLKKITNCIYASPSNFSIPHNNVLRIIETNSGDIWVGTAMGLCKLISRNGDQFVFEKIGNQLLGKHFFVQDVIEDAFGDLWIATKSDGLLKYNVITKSLVSYLKKMGNKEIDIRALAFDLEGALWIGSLNGLSVLAKNKELYKVFKNQTEISSLGKIKSIFRDKKGSIWVGTYYRGVNIWDVSNTNFITINQNSGKRSLSFDVVSSIASDKKDYLYFGTEGGGLTVYNEKLNKTKFITTANNKELVSDNIKSLYLSEKGLLWIGTFTEGVSVYNCNTNTFENHRISKDLQDYLKQVGVYAIKKGEGNYVWLGTFDKGLIRYDTDDFSYSQILMDETSSNFLSHKRVRSVLVDCDKRVWVGTQSGLNQIIFKGLNNYRIKHFFFDESGLSGDDILTLFEDSRNRIWVGVKEKGLFLFDGEKFKRVEIPLGNINITSVNSILEDKKGNIWFSSNQGIVKYDFLNKSAIIHDQTNGLVSAEYNNNASTSLGANKFFFGGPGGITYFDADAIAVNQYVPQVLLTDFKIKNKSVQVNNESNILTKSIVYTKELTLSYDKANFSINFSIPNFINPTNNQYMYRLVGIDNDWITTKNTEVNYTIQNPGTYYFEVKGANNDGNWNETPTRLKINVNPAPWRSVWAFILYAILIGLSLYGLIWIMKSKAILKHELELEYLEAERTKEVNLAKLKFFTNISHEFRTPLTLILGPLQQILSGYSGSNALHKKLLVIESSANHLLQLINRLMDFRKLENNQFNLQAAEGNIVKFLQEIFLSFSEFAKVGSYNYSFNCAEEEILVYFDRYKLERVFYNLISNAFKYTPKGGTISIKIFKEGNKIIIEVKDSGVGIADEYMDKVFDRFFEVAIHNNSNANYVKGTGIGLSIAKNIVNLHHGNIILEKNKTQGVCFKVGLLLGKEHLSEKEIVEGFKISDDITQYTSQLTSMPKIVETDLDDLVLSEKKQTILIVEDNNSLRAFMKGILLEEYNVIQAENGKEAMKKALKYIPDLIVSDVIMPKMVGTELCSAIKENIKTSHIPVILLTSRTSLIYKFDGLERGADDYISKPFNLKEFKLRIKNILASKQRLKDRFLKEDSFKPNEIVVSSLDEKLLKKAFQIVEDNIANEQLDVPFFCEELGVSRSLLFTKIKAWTNFTPNEFIREIRLKRAAQLLEQNKLNVSQVCYKVGFKTPKYFSKCFQNKFGITPSQYSEKYSSDFS